MAVPILEAIQSNSTLVVNVRQLVEGRLAQELTADEAGRLEAALQNALSVLQADGAERQRILSGTIAAALLSPGGAMLWAVVVETAESEVSDIDAFCAAVLDTVSTIAGAVFASAMGMP